jgi:hypothetical protein
MVVNTSGVAAPITPFKTIAELRNALKSAAVKAAVGGWLSDSEPDLPTVIKRSVAGNTFRSMKAGARAASDVYREYALAAFSKEWRELISQRANEDIRAFVIRHTNALMLEWLNAELPPLAFGPAAKLINLSIKHLPKLSDVPLEERRDFAKHMDIPLDKYSLGNIRVVCPRLSIPEGASMGFVKDEAQYIDIQDEIRRACGPSASPFDYEICAYNNRFTTTWSAPLPAAMQN